MTSRQQLAASCTLIVKNGRVSLSEETSLSRGQSLFAPGQLIDNKYKIIELLGEGGMGAVYRAYHELLQKEVALKTFRSSDISDEAWTRFQREAKAIARLQHKNIVQVFDFGSAPDHLPYYTMEVLQGENLAECLEREGKLSPVQSLKIFAQAAEALAYAHRQHVVHRDIKPANIFLQSQSNNQLPGVKIVDFGIAKLVEDASADGDQQATQAGIIFGSPLYMSPEQSLGLVVDQRSDIYSFGCALFETMTGAPPFVGESVLVTVMQHQIKVAPKVSSLVSGSRLPQRLDGLVARLLAKDPEDRFQNFTDVLAEINDCLTALDSIGRSLSPENRQENGAEGADAARATANAAKRMKIIAALSIVVCLLTVICLCIKPSMPPPKAKVLAVNKLAPVKAIAKRSVFSEADYFTPDIAIAKTKFATDRRSASQDKTPYELGVKNGRRFFRFPDYADIGYFNDVNDRFVCVCKGAFDLPESTALVFCADSEILYEPRLLDRFQSSFIYGVKLVKRGDLPWTDEHLKYVCHLKNLRALIISSCSQIDQKAIAMINQLQNLTLLDIAKTGIANADLPNFKRLNKLSALTINNNGNASSLFALLKRGGVHYNMTNLVAKECEITDSDIGSIGEAKGLLQLDLSRNKITGKNIDCLASLRGLKLLYLKGNPLEPDSVDKLAKLQQLVLLEVGDSHWPPGAVARLRSKLPHCKVNAEGDH